MENATSGPVLGAVRAKRCAGWRRGHTFALRALAGQGVPTHHLALNYFLLGCGTVQVWAAAMLDSAVGPKVIKELMADMTDFLDRNAERGWKNLPDFRGLRRANIVPHSQIKRPDTADYHGGSADELHERYAKPIEL